MSGRVTIMCEWGGCNAAATTVNRWSAFGDDDERVNIECDEHAERERAWDSDGLQYSVYVPLLNPGTCSDDDVANVRAAIEAMCRLLRTCGDSPEDIEDRAVLELCAQEVRHTYYERCPDPRCALGFCDCRGTGLVLRRRSDGTTVIDEIDAGSVAA